MSGANFVREIQAEPKLYMSDVDGVLLVPPDYELANTDSVDFLLRARAAGHEYGVFTDRTRLALTAFFNLQLAELEPHIEITRESSQYKKSDPNYWRDFEKEIASSGLYIYRENVVVIEDTPENWLAARDVNYEAILVRHYKNANRISVMGLDDEAVDSLADVEIPERATL